MGEAKSSNTPLLPATAEANVVSGGSGRVTLHDRLDRNPAKQGHSAPLGAKRDQQREPRLVAATSGRMERQKVRLNPAAGSDRQHSGQDFFQIETSRYRSGRVTKGWW